LGYYFLMCTWLGGAQLNFLPISVLGAIAIAILIVLPFVLKRTKGFSAGLGIAYATAYALLIASIGGSLTLLFTAFPYICLSGYYSSSLQPLAWVVFGFTIYMAIVLVAAHLIGLAAESKNRSRVAFFWMTLLIGPVIPGIIVAVIRPSDANSSLGEANKSLAKNDFEELTILYSNGLITKAEFEAKKKELLDRL